MTIKVPFDRNMHSFLVQEGYTHIYCKGIVPEQDELEESENYYLIPLKPADSRLQYQETDMMIEEINSTDILDMADGDEFISFFLELSANDYDLFVLKNN